MDQLPENVDSKFRFVLLASRRAEDMMRGSQPRVQKPMKYTTAAMTEIEDALVGWEIGPFELEDESEPDEE